MILLVLLALACHCDDRENLPVCDPGGEHANRLYCDECGDVWLCAANEHESAWLVSDIECDCVNAEGFVNSDNADCVIGPD